MSVLNLFSYRSSASSGSASNKFINNIYVCLFVTDIVIKGIANIAFFRNTNNNITNTSNFHFYEIFKAANKHNTNTEPERVKLQKGDIVNWETHFSDFFYKLYSLLRTKCKQESIINNNW